MPESRRVVASGSIRIRDDEVGDPVFGTLDFTSVGVVSTNQPSVRFVSQSKCVGGEVRPELDLDAIFENNGNVRISGEARLFEGASCNTNEQEDSQSITLTVPKDGQAQVDIKVESTGTGGGDWAKGKVTFTNTNAEAVVGPVPLRLAFKSARK